MCVCVCLSGVEGDGVYSVINESCKETDNAGDFSRTCCKTPSGFNPTRRDRAQLLWTRWSANTLSIASTRSHTLIYFKTPLTCSSLCLVVQNHRMQYTMWRQYPILQGSKVFDYSANVLQGANEIQNNREREGGGG